MSHHPDPLATLAAPEVLRRAEHASLPYLGYHLLRETLTQRLLGESEAPILYWIGKGIGRELLIQSAQGLVLPFIRLGLGRLELKEEKVDRLSYELTHSLYDCIAKERLQRSLHLECGIIAGAVSRWREREAAARLTVHRQRDENRTVALIEVSL